GYKLLGLRNASDYLSFVNQGGELIVLNTNGYHTFGKQLFDIENTTILCNQIKGANYNITLGTDIPVDVITINNTDSEIIANYASVNQSSPFILAQNYGFGKIYYVNLFPILRAIQLGMIKTPPILILDKILNFLELPSFVYEEIEVDGFVKAIEFQNFLLLTNSVLVDPNVIIPVLQVQNQHGLTEYFNVSNFQLNCQSLSLRSSSGKMDLGTGFYSRIESNRTVSVIPLNQDGVLKFSSNGSHFEIDTIHSIVFPTQESKLFFVRAPRITTQNCIFKEIYSYGSLYLFSGAYGQDLHIYGSANFSIVVSDTYSMISGIEILGSYQLSPQLVLYDALSTIPVAIGFSLIIIPLLIGFSVYRRRKW
ncbi:MAG: hypothetical protein ACFFBX_05300, partial [Promethearchaeota archaeon]